jgi:RNA polymerase subunit RPABC4/transcription elongation factor Spt4
MDIQTILRQLQPFLAMFVALLVAFLTAAWVSAVIWAFRDIRARSRDVFAHVLATLLVLLFFPLFPIPGLILYWILRPRETLTEVYERTLEEEALLQGIEERMACPGCNRRIADDFLFCPTCHTRLKKACVACGRMLHLKWSICPYCGASQSGAQLASAVVLPAGESGEVRRIAGATRVSLAGPSGADETGAEEQEGPIPPAV